MFDRDPKGFGGLPRKTATTEVNNCAGDHQWHFFAARLKGLLDGSNGGLAIEGIEDGLDQENIHATIKQATCLLGIGFH